VDSVGNQEGTGRVWGGLKLLLACFSSFLCLLYGGTPAPEFLRTAHRRIPFVAADRPRAGSRPFLVLLCHISLGDDSFDLLRELNKIKIK